MLRASSSVLATRVSSQRVIQRCINTHSRPHDDSGRDGDTFERDHARDRASGPTPSWGPEFSLGSPRQLVEYLNTFIVGQERAKKVLSVAYVHVVLSCVSCYLSVQIYPFRVFNHYNRVRAKLQDEMRVADEEGTSALPADEWEATEHQTQTDGTYPLHPLVQAVVALLTN